MKINNLCACFLAIAAASSAWAQNPSGQPAKPVLKITSSNGKVIYSDRQLKIPTNKVEPLRGAITDKVLAASPEPKPASAPAGAASQPTSLVEWAKQQEEAMSKQNKEFSDARDKINCEQAKSALKSLNAPRPSRNTDKGESELLTDPEIVQEKAHAQKMILESCR